MRAENKRLKRLLCLIMGVVMLFGTISAAAASGGILPLADGEFTYEFRAYSEEKGEEVVLASGSAPANTYITAPEIPGRSGYVFAGWTDQNNNSFDPLYNTLWDNLVLTAQWDEAWKITYVDAESQFEESVWIRKGDVPTSAHLPENSPAPQEGKVLYSWYNEAGKSTLGDSPVTADVTYQAVWAEESELTPFHKVTQLSQLQVGAHYVIVYRYNVSWGADSVYAPSLTAGDSSYTTYLPMVSDNTLWLTDPEADNVLIMTNRAITSSTGDSLTADTRLESLDGSKRLKLGTGGGNYEPMWDANGGTVVLGTRTGNPGIWYVQNSNRGMYWNSETKDFAASKGYSYSFEIWTDAEAAEDLGESRYVEYLPAGISPAKMSLNEEMLIVYTDPNGNSFALITPDDDSNNAVKVNPSNIETLDGKTTGSLTVSRRYAWVINDEWEVRDESTALKDAYRTQLVQAKQYLWMSGSSMFGTDAGNKVYIDFERDTEDGDVYVYVHGDPNADRYLGWDSENQKFVGAKAKNEAIKVRIFGSNPSNVYRTYYPLNSLELLQTAHSFIITVPNPADPTQEDYRIIGRPTSGNNWLAEFQFNADGSITTNNLADHSTEFEPGDLLETDSKGTRFDYNVKLLGREIYLYLQNLPKTTSSGEQMIPFDKGVRKVRFSYGAADANGNREIYLRGSGGDTWLGVVNGEFTTVPTIEEAVPIHIYIISDETPVRVHYYRYDDATKNLIAEDPITSQKYFTLKRLEDVWVKDGAKVPEGTDGAVRYSFLGWSQDTDYSNSNGTPYLDLASSANLYDYDDAADKGIYKDNVKEKFALVGGGNPDRLETINLHDVVEEGQTDISLVPLYAVRGFDTVVTGGTPVLIPGEGEGHDRYEDVPVIGVSDWKELQGADGYKNLAMEKWLGSINVEIYKDGQPWVDSILYFSYHNDNAADLNIKFIWDELVEKYAGAKDSYRNPDGSLAFPNMPDDPLYWYMADHSSTDVFPDHDQVGHFMLDGVIASQGGSEDGLKYAYNWMTYKGGQLDNVEGGSTVKLYVTTKYNVKYYLDDHPISLSQWIDLSYYTTRGTINLFTYDAAGADYTVDKKNNVGLLDPDITEWEDEISFLPDEMDRGQDTYKTFTYFMTDYAHEFKTKEMPTEELIEAMFPGEGRELSSIQWVLKSEPTLDEDGNEIVDIIYVDWEKVVEILGDYYGQGNTYLSFKESNVIGNPEADSPYTYHLYAYTKVNLVIEKKLDGDLTADDVKDKTFTFTITGPKDVAEKEFPMEGATAESVTFDKEGKATVSMIGAGKITIQNLLPGGKYQYEVVEDEEVAAIKGYDLEVSYDGDFTTDVAKSAEGTVTNKYTKNMGSLTVEKKVSGTAGETDRQFHFTVTLDDKEINGVYGDMEFKDGVATFTLKHGEHKTAADLPAGIGFTVTETEADQDGYTTTVSGASGTIVKDEEAKAIFDNFKNAPPTTPPPTTTTPPPETGDSGNGWLYMALISLAGVATFGVLAFKVRTKRA